MKLKHSTLSIPEENPFEFDRLERKPHAEILTQFILSIEEPLTMSVEAGWGHGKTTFLRMWTQSLKNNNFSVISFNAWESDYSEDPFIPFVAELRKAISEVKANSDEVKNKLTRLSEMLRKSGIQIAKRTLPVAAKMMTAGLLDTDELIEKAAGDAIEKAIEQKFDEYEADQEYLDNFKDALKKAVQAMKDQGKQLPLVFLIDELDRCRPTYTLSLLERIKHIFNIDGIAFVLAIDREQLLESVRTVYGSKTDANRYLRRFIDYRYTLPAPNPDNFPAYLMSAMNFHEQFSRVTNDANAGGQFLATFVVLSTCFEMRLRDQEHAFSILAVVWRTLKNREDINPFLLAILLVLKVADEEMYGHFAKGTTSADSLIVRITSKPEGEKFMKENYGIAMETYLRLATESDEFINRRLVNLKHDAASVNASDYMRQKLHLMERFMEFGGKQQSFKKVINSLEISNQFKN